MLLLLRVADAMLLMPRKMIRYAMRDAMMPC